MMLSTRMDQKQPPEMHYKKGFLIYFIKCTGKHLCQSLLFNKVAGLSPANLLKKETPAQHVFHRTSPDDCFCIIPIEIYFTFSSSDYHKVLARELMLVSNLFPVFCLFSFVYVKLCNLLSMLGLPRGPTQTSRI